MRLRHLLLAATLLASATPAPAGPTEDFKALTDDYWAFVMREYPTFASQLGIRDYDDKLSDISLAAEDRRAAAAAALSGSGSTPFPMPACRPPTGSTRRSSSAAWRNRSRPIASASG